MSYVLALNKLKQTLQEHPRTYRRRHTQTEDVPKYLCADALPSLWNALTDLQIRFPHLRILLAKADVTDAFRNVRVSPHQGQNFCYVVEDMLATDFRLAFGWAASPGYWGLMASAAEHDHLHTTVDGAVILTRRQEDYDIACQNRGPMGVGRSRPESE